MRFILRITGKLMRWHKTWPHWARDLYQVVKWLNAIELIPTLAAMALAPRHFYRRLPAILERRRRMCRTPIYFFANSAALFIALFLLRYPDLRSEASQGEAFFSIVMLILLTPFLMPVLGVVLWVAYQLPNLIPTSNPFP